MSVVDALRAANARTERWADVHPFAWTIVVAATTGGALALAAIVLADESVPSAVIQGVLFGVTYGTLSAVFSIQ